MFRPNVIDVLLDECFVGGDRSDLDPDWEKRVHSIHVESQVPDEFGENVEVRCIFSRTKNEELLPWKIAFRVLMADVADGTDPEDVAFSAIQVSHPYVRQLLRQLGALMDDDSLSLPATIPLRKEDSRVEA